MDLISVAKDGKELGVLQDIRELDVDIGKTNDFVLTLSAANWADDMVSQADHWYAVGYGEVGGKIGGITSATGKKQIQLRGFTWRGLLDKHIIEPDAGTDYKIITGEANAVLKALIEPQLGNLFVVTNAQSGFWIDGHKFERYETLLSGIVSMLQEVGAKIDIRYIPGSYRSSEYSRGYVQVSAVPIVDYSESVEFSQDGKIDFTASVVSNGCNHLICLGKGDLRDRQVIHLYADASGNIGDQQFIFGEDEIAETYDYPAAESLDDLRRYGIRRLKERGNRKNLRIALNTIEAQIGDIVGGEEQITGITLKKSIEEIILKVDRSGRLSITHKVGD